ncbi:hypothetical protein [Bacillus atrophaeus]|uniref:hypothetical protein n=1 Tax=Bacillus atrophaeus TaxID=1452 RepID=UPI002880A0A6|nr:hypothetical protein [Bacillus atrophaeus]
MTNQASSSAKHKSNSNTIRYLTEHTAIQDQSLGEALFPGRYRGNGFSSMIRTCKPLVAAAAPAGPLSITTTS